MDDRLTETKRRLSARYLGREGIHAFGLRRSEGAVAVYVDLGSDSVEQERLLLEIEREAAPFPVRLLREGRPRIG